MEPVALVVSWGILGPGAKESLDFKLDYGIIVVGKGREKEMNQYQIHMLYARPGSSVGCIFRGRIEAESATEAVKKWWRMKANKNTHRAHGRSKGVTEDVRGAFMTFTKQPEIRLRAVAERVCT